MDGLLVQSAGAYSCPWRHVSRRRPQTGAARQACTVGAQGAQTAVSKPRRNTSDAERRSMPGGGKGCTIPSK
eukprot:13793841-Alexandrium_andersonii.AAC.1